MILREMTFAALATVDTAVRIMRLYFKPLCMSQIIERGMPFLRSVALFLLEALGWMVGTVVGTPQP